MAAFIVQCIVLITFHLVPLDLLRKASSLVSFQKINFLQARFLKINYYFFNENIKSIISVHCILLRECSVLLLMDDQMSSVFTISMVYSQLLQAIKTATDYSTCVIKLIISR